MKKIFTVIIVLVIVSKSFGQTKDTATFNFSVQQCIEYAYKNQSKVLNADMDQQIAKFKVREITGLGLPQINSSLDVKDFLKVPSTAVDASRFPGAPQGIPPGTLVPFQMGVQYSATAGVDVSQLIFSASYFVGLQASKTYMELSKKNVERTKIEVATVVSKAYYSVLVNEERFELLKTNVDRLKKLMDDTKVMNENGFVEKIDLLRVVVSYNNLLVEKEKVERFLALNYNLLKFQVGMSADNKLVLTDKLNSLKDQAKVNLEGKVDYTQRVEYSMMAAQKRLNQLDLRKNRYSFIPTIVAYGSLAKNGYGADFKGLSSGDYWYPMTVIGAKLTLPIFDGLQTYNKIQQAKLTLLKSQNDSKMLEQSIDLEVGNARASYQNQLASLETNKKNIELATEVYNVSKIKYDQGTGSNLEIINADASLKEAQTNYFSSLYDFMVAKIDLDKATGVIK